MSDESKTDQRQGVLAIIGGHEDRKGERVILREFARRLRGQKVIISTVASHEPEGYFDGYRRALDDLGVRDLTELYIEDRSEARDEEKLKELEEAAGVFFSGGDQLRIHQQIGHTPIERLVREIYRRGGVVAGTSAGAAAMGEIMLVEGASRESHRIGDIKMAPGLALLRGVIIDQHFAQRGRIGRLLGAVAQNPQLLGIGIDEDTAIFVEGGKFTVVGNGAVYVVDGAGVTHSNIASAKQESVLSMYDVRLHVLSSGDAFDLTTRRPEEVPDVRESHEREIQAQG
ncbi:MAG TPA: cyanophycinase [Azospirillaceae bacterium]|nr:cyanophycinase [Azospirillaceae bacterium]